MENQIFQVDTFTEKPFSGNPAVVCISSSPRKDAWMQDVAREMNFSETAFLTFWDDGFNLRWFTPKVEMDLCGHATLAAAHVLWEENIVEPDQQVRFQTLSGLITAERQDNWIIMNFPSEPNEACDPPAELGRALGVPLKYVGRNRFDFLAEVESERILRSLRPDFQLLKALPSRGIIVTSRSASLKYDFVSRFFAPAAGIDEDPITGSAHCCLGPFWGERLGKLELKGYQASSRGGCVRVRIGQDCVYLGGQAITVSRGVLLR